jgi:3-hydroxyisobutyrate dehydrogenase-like beta-hydroxyacid dehydrogenase
MQTIGFTGLGHMDGNMAVGLLGVGYTAFGKARNRAPWTDARLRELRTVPKPPVIRGFPARTTHVDQRRTDCEDVEAGELTA